MLALSLISTLMYSSTVVAPPPYGFDKRNFCLCCRDMNLTTGDYTTYNYGTEDLCDILKWTKSDDGTGQIAHCVNDEAYQKAQTFADGCLGQGADGSFCCPELVEGKEKDAPPCIIRFGNVTTTNGKLAI
ncbi:hypothetical protein SMMN14_03002 [Sphaerulina musiva]